MRRQVVLLLASIAWLFGGAALHAATKQINTNFIQCNYDFTNMSGREVFDVEIILQGVVMFTGFYNNDFSYTPPTRTITADGNTSLHWTQPSDRIFHNTKIHVGYTPDRSYGNIKDCPLLALYWTDENHNRVSSSFIGTVKNYLTGTKQVLTNRTLRRVNVYDIQMACQTAALPLDALNATNEYLAGAMVPVAAPVVLEPGQTLEIPVNVPCRNCHCVTNFKTFGEGFGAIFSPWVQEYVPE